MHFYSKVIVSLFLRRKHQAWAGIYLNWYWEIKEQQIIIKRLRTRMCEAQMRNRTANRTAVIEKHPLSRAKLGQCGEMKLYSSSSILAGWKWRWDTIRHHNAFVSCYMLSIDESQICTHISSEAHSLFLKEPTYLTWCRTSSYSFKLSKFRKCFCL